MVICMRKFTWSNHLRFVSQEEYEGCVCMLKKAMYGLEHSSRAWFWKFFKVVLEFGVYRCQINHSIFHLLTNAGYILLMVYVDNIVITENNPCGITRSK
jgi:hypothetical protein